METEGQRRLKLLVANWPWCRSCSGRLEGWSKAVLVEVLRDGEVQKLWQLCGPCYDRHKALLRPGRFHHRDLEQAAHNWERLVTDGRQSAGG